MQKRFFLMVATLLCFLGIVPAGVMGRDLLGDVNIHGFVSQGFIISDEYNYLSHKSTEGSFEYNEAGLNFGKQLTSRLGLGLQFFARDIGDAGNNTITLDWAYGEYHFRDWLGIRFGKVKLPFGLWGEIRDYEMLRPWIVLPQGRYRDLLRDSIVAANGVGLYGNVLTDAAGSFDYFTVVGNLYSIPGQGSRKVTNDAFGGILEQQDTQDDMIYIGNLRWNTPLRGLMVGIFGFVTDTTYDLYMPALELEAEMRIESIWSGIMAEYTWHNLSVWAEYFTMDVKTDIKALDRQSAVRPEDYYLGAAYRFARWFQLGGYYAESYRDGKDKDGDDAKAGGFPAHKAWEKDVALTLRFDFNKNWVFKVEGHMVDGTRNVLLLDNPASDLAKRYFHYAAAKLTISF